MTINDSCVTTADAANHYFFYFIVENKKSIRMSARSTGPDTVEVKRSNQGFTGKRVWNRRRGRARQDESDIQEVAFLSNKLFIAQAAEEEQFGGHAVV